MLKGFLIGLGVAAGLMAGAAGFIGAGLIHAANKAETFESRAMAAFDNLANMDSALAEIEASPDYKACVVDLVENFDMMQEHAESRCAGWFLAEPE